MIPFQHMVYVPNIKQYKPFDKIKNESFETLSGTKLRSLLDKGEKIPDWFSFPEIIKSFKKRILLFISKDLQFFSLDFLVLENLPLQMGY